MGRGGGRGETMTDNELWKGGGDGGEKGDYTGGILRSTRDYIIGKRKEQRSWGGEGRSYSR